MTKKLIEELDRVIEDHRAELIALERVREIIARRGDAMAPAGVLTRGVMSAIAGGPINAGEMVAVAPKRRRPKAKGGKRRAYRRRPPDAVDAAALGNA